MELCLFMLPEFSAFWVYVSRVPAVGELAIQRARNVNLVGRIRHPSDEFARS